MKEIEIYIDGASKGNPGPSGIGVVICQDGVTIKNISSYIGNATNNVAEYTALIYGLQEGLITEAESIEINTDSQLLHRQITKAYKVKNANLLGLYNQVIHLMSTFKKVKINHISRIQNRGADKLASKAVKEASPTGKACLPRDMH
jgi:ribonuclease HI